MTTGQPTPDADEQALRARHRKGYLSASDETWDINPVCLAEGHAWPCDTALALSLIEPPTIETEQAHDALTRLLAELPAEFVHPRNGAHRSRESFQVIKERNVGTVHDALWDLQVAVGFRHPQR